MDSYPPLEPYKAATTISRNGTSIPHLPQGVRRLTKLISQTPIQGKICRSNLVRCYGLVTREQCQQVSTPPSDFGIQSVSQLKPTATVVPTTVAASDSLTSFNRNRSVARDIHIQTDDVGIDVDLLFHIEDMIRTQRTLTLPKYNQMDVDKSSSPLVKTGLTETTDVAFLQHRISELEETLSIQTKVNTDLKRLLVSALAGNSTLADKLIDLASDNVNLSDRSQDLAAQKAALAEVVDTAEIAANVWRAKCLAGRVLATEAAQRLALANRQVQLARHALAHLLGERSRLRIEMGQTAALLCSASAKSPGSVSPPVAEDSIGLASLCHHLASLSHPLCEGAPSVIQCRSDSPGEHLALCVLKNSFPGDVIIGPSDSGQANAAAAASYRLSGEISTPVPPPLIPDSDDIIVRALKTFEATKSLVPDAPIPCLCKGCTGNITVI